MSDLIRVSGIWMKPKGQESKSTCTNTVTSSRTLVKSHEVFQKGSPKAVLEKSWSEKFHIKLTQKRLLWSPFWSYITTCNFIEKEPHHSYFPMTFEKIFQNTVLCQNTGKATEGSEVFVRMCFSKKLIWRISPNSSKRNYDGFSLVKKQPETLFRKDCITAVFLCHRGNKSMFKIHS